MGEIFLTRGGKYLTRNGKFLKRVQQALIDTVTSAPAEVTAGEEFVLTINLLVQSNDTLPVTVKSSLQSEVLSQNVTFVNGVGTITANTGTPTVTIAGTAILTVTVSYDTFNLEGLVVVANTPVRFIITKQPTGGAGSYDGSPTSIGEVVLQVVDVYNNPTYTDVNVLASISYIDPVTSTATLTGIGVGDASTDEGIYSDVSGEITFNLNLDEKNGDFQVIFTESAYVFSYNGFSPVSTSTFTMTQMEDESGFEIVSPESISGLSEFNIEVIDAKKGNGELVNGTKNISVLRIRLNVGTEAMLYDNEEFNFSNGELNIPVVAPDYLGSQNNYRYYITIFDISEITPNLNKTESIDIEIIL